MTLEHWDQNTRKFVLYRSTGEHNEDCKRFPFERIPKRVFLDTNVINVLVKHCESVSITRQSQSTPIPRRQRTLRRLGKQSRKQIRLSVVPSLCSTRLGTLDAIHMPKVAARPLRHASCCFPHASPVSGTRAGKQKNGPEGPF